MSSSQGPVGTPSPWFDPAGVREVARRAVERCAPGETEFFDVVADGFFARGSVSLRGRPRRGELVGFDPDDIGALLSTGALMAATRAANGAVESSGGMGSKGLVSRIGRWWQNRRPVPTDPNAAVPAPADRAAALIDLAAVARRAGLSEADAARIAAAVLAEVDPRR